MNVQEIMTHLESLKNENTIKIFKNHGAVEPLLGVKIEDLKKIQKKVKYNYSLSKELFDTGVSDARYLAGLIADVDKMSKEDFNHWANQANWHMISECTVAWTAAESKLGWELALEWIESDEEKIASAGWATLGGILSFVKNEDLDPIYLEKLLERVKNTIHSSQERVKYTMNGFVIAVGAYYPELNQKAIEIAKEIGKVSVYMGDTSCKVPYAPEYIDKSTARGSLNKKKKMVRC